MRQVAKDMVESSLGCFRVSTIQTIAGGAPETTGLFPSPFTEQDYVPETPWPFETMVFRSEGITGLYHAAYGTEQEALDGHALVVRTIRDGLEFGGGVEGPFGNPSLTAEQWRERGVAK